MEEKIRLNPYFAMAVWDALKAQGYPVRSSNGIEPDRTFTKEELQKVKNLKLTNVHYSLEGIEHLSNLSSLTIDTLIHSDFSKERASYGISQENIFKIENLTQLKHLEITNQENISSIDVSKLTNLESFTITNNPNLEEILGLENNRTINYLTMYNNINLGKIKNFDKFIVENASLEGVELDVLMYPWAIGYKTANQPCNQKALDKLEDIEINVKWSEQVASKTTTINNHQMKKLHSTALNIFNTYKMGSSSDLECVCIVDRWFSKNVPYNNDALESNLRGVVHDGILQGPARGANGTYSALVQKTCVCEGYTRGGQYLLQLKGIKTSNVHCLSGKDNFHVADYNTDTKNLFIIEPTDGHHSIIRVDRESGSFYCDFCWNSGRYQRGHKNHPYTLRTKSQISNTHTLSYNDRNIADQTPIPEEILNAVYKSVDEKMYSIESAQQINK